MSYVAFTHPNVVCHFKNEGDSIFQSHFDVSNEYTRPFFQDGIIRTTEKLDKSIHVKYVFKKTAPDSSDTQMMDVVIIAVSDDNGTSWFFAEEEDYYNNTIFKKDERLIRNE